MKKMEGVLRRTMHSRDGVIKRRMPLVKYYKLGEHLHNFFLQIRDAKGTVSRSLLEECISASPQDVQLDLMKPHVKRRDEFFARWRRLVGNVVFRHGANATFLQP